MGKDHKDNNLTVHRILLFRLHTPALNAMLAASAPDAPNFLQLAISNSQFAAGVAKAGNFEYGM